MKSIALLSDTHNYLDERIFPYLEQCDEIWHAGDIGNLDIIDHLKKFAKTRAVYGNIDNDTIRKELNKILIFKCEEVKVLMTHIGGYPGKYEKGKEIKGLGKKTESIIFHCGTIKRSEKVFTNGGRVLAVTSFGKDFKIAISKSYSSLKNIKYEGKIYRKDIGFDL